VALYIAGGSIFWPQAAVMVVGAVAGGYAGVHLARRTPAAWLRGLITAVGLVTALAFLR